MAIQFHETECGRRFFNKQLPDLIKAINRSAEAKEKENEGTKTANKEVAPTITQDAFNSAEQYLINSGIDANEAESVLQDICYVLLGADYRIQKTS